MASHDSEFKPAKVDAPQAPSGPASGSGAAQEASHDIIASRPQFTNLGLDGVKKMVANSNPEEVGNVAGGWKKVRVSLVGDDWNSGIKKHFDDAVTKVLQTWHGSSADQFAKQAQKISDNFANLAPYPHNTGHVLEQIADRLAKVKGLVEGVKEPSTLERAADRLHDFSTSGTGKIAAFVPGGAGVAAVSDMLGITGDGRDDSGLNRDLANPKMSIWDAMNKNRDNLSIDRERQLQAAHYMEQLATTYRAGTTALGGVPRYDDGSIKKPENNGDGGGGTIPPIGPFGPTPTGPSGGTSAPKIPGLKGGGYTTPQPLEPPRPNGINGGIGDIPKTPATPIKTGLEGLSGGTGLGTGGAGGIGGGLGGGIGTGGLGSGSGVGAGSGAGIGGSGMPGAIGGIGGAMGGARGGAMGGARGGAGAGAGAGARGGRPGMPGMGGAAAGGKGAGAKGGGAAGKGSALARQKGGVVGGKGGKTGAGAQGGSGLHRSRGGTQKGATGGRRPAGMAGAHGANGAKGKDKGNENGQRPDYLVEDEETWTPERNVAPKVIE
ncbi:hypothetical protein [Streptomyces sp. NPDC059122]|uniref:hypothetical protein n=1 Tax=Streptomyces sp. NPDC059122 TaxID=3346732 RepID=UPI00369E14A1